VKYFKLYQEQSKTLINYSEWRELTAQLMIATFECKFSLFIQSLTSIRFCRITKMRCAEKFVLFFSIFIFGNVVRLANCQSSGIRLSTDIAPTNYDIHLKVDVVKREFNGSETIYVHVFESTDLIELHWMDLDIETIQIFDASDIEISISSISFDDVNQKHLVTLTQRLEKDREYQIKITFDGEIKDDMKGLYRSSYYEFSFFLR
jgi:Peptidase M1 N-terminal domain